MGETSYQRRLPRPPQLHGPLVGAAPRFRRATSILSACRLHWIRDRRQTLVEGSGQKRAPGVLIRQRDPEQAVLKSVLS
jgi:hypothetical protein